MTSLLRLRHFIFYSIIFSTFKEVSSLLRLLVQDFIYRKTTQLFLRVIATLQDSVYISSLGQQFSLRPYELSERDPPRR